MKKMMRSMKQICLAMCFAGLISVEAKAADSFDSNWQMDATYTWHYIMNSGEYATRAWVHDKTNQDWYLLNDAGEMQAGLVSSYGRYYLLDTNRGTGHYGRLMKNGFVYNGITIQADTSSEYEGALKDVTLRALKSQGLDEFYAKSVNGTKHVEGGEVTYEEPIGTKHYDTWGYYVTYRPGADITGICLNSYGVPGYMDDSEVEYFMYTCEKSLDEIIETHKKYGMKFLTDQEVDEILEEGYLTIDDLRSSDCYVQTEWGDGSGLHS